MRYKLFGRTGMRVAELCLGAMTFGEESGFGVARDECKKVFDTYLEAGGNFIDTANMYSGGSSERILSEFIASERDRLVLATKYSIPMAPNDPNSGGNHRKNIVQSLDASLKRLGTDYIDVYWMHVWDFTTPIEEVMRALDDMVRSGKVLHIGISNAPSWIISAANMYAIERGLTPFSSMQLHYNLVERTIETDFMPLANMQDMAVTAWSPLAGGLLTGKFNRNVDEGARKGSRLASHKRTFSDTELDIAQKVTDIAKEIGQSSSQVALRWLHQNNKTVVIPLIGARTEEQLKDNLGCLDFELGDDHINALNEVSAIKPVYPASMLANPNVARLMFGEIASQVDNHHDYR